MIKSRNAKRVVWKYNRDAPYLFTYATCIDRWAKVCLTKLLRIKKATTASSMSENVKSVQYEKSYVVGF